MSKTLVIITLFCIFILNGNANIYAQNHDTKKENTLIRPPYLKMGDSVAIVAPSGVLNHRDKEVNQAIDLLKSWGLNVIVGKHVFSKSNHFAGTDNERADDFQIALDNPNIKAIWCARGGYGTVRMIDKLDYTRYKASPKWIIGYSDITAIHNQLNIEGSQSIHALMCTSLTDDLSDIEESISSFKNALFGKSLSYTIDGSDYNKTGSVTAPLVGGNLTLLHTMLGSKTSIDTSGKILFIEEIGEYKYHIDRMLQSLKRAGYFENCKGVLVGGMSKMRKNTTLWGTSVEQLILDALVEYDFPIAFNMPAGHDKDNRALILGRIVELKVRKDKSTVIFDDK
ncbi:MAG: LD-carboxypeptidase [Flavobacteriaceae bacterium]|nr:LD-carboxypeptidase [Flavobacteriaceae bacterium]